jgi:mono/diheme cytochrome c family protein
VLSPLHAAARQGYNAAMAATSLLILLLATAGLDPAAPDFFAQHVAPVIRERCVACHDEDQHKGGLRLHSLTGWKAGGKSGADIYTPGHPEASELLRRISASDPDERMPPKGAPLSDAQVDAIRAWLAAGAPWDQAVMEAPMRRQPAMRGWHPPARHSVALP